MKNLIMICAVVLVSTVAKAGGFIEPYIGYQTGKVTYTNNVEGDSKGVGLGLRAGYQAVIPWIALDVQLGQGKVTGITPEDDYSYTDVGVTAGASVPFLRPFVGYIPSVKHKFKSSTGSTSDYEGSGLKFGVGIKILPLIDINIEQVTYTYKKSNGLDLVNDAKMKNLMIGVGMTF